jgi:hypothetical protein
VPLGGKTTGGRSSPKWLLVAAIVPAGMIVFFVARGGAHRGEPTTDMGREEQTTRPMTSADTAHLSGVACAAPTPGGRSPSGSALEGDGAGSLSPSDLSSPRQTVDTQMKLLAEGRDGEFRATFLPGVAISADQIEACRKRVANTVVRPDWEMAEDVLVNGHRVRRVSMFGKSMTGFHDVQGKWLADAVWCVPVGLP